MRDKRALWVAVLTALAFAIRAAIAFRGGIWADEGFFMALVETPSWKEMMSFLHFHESHPPLFYAMMRVWIAIVGHGDAGALMLPVLIGSALVPVTYLIGTRLFSARAGLLAAFLVTVASGLAEYSAQLRPYGFLPLLVLLSCYALVRVIDRGGLWRIAAYMLSTTLLLYTHNWAWLVLAAEVVAAAVALGARPAARGRIALDLFFAWFGIGLLFLPWLPAFLYQFEHAGHHTVIGRTASDAVELVFFAALSGFEMILLGTFAKQGKLMMSVGAVMAVVAAIASSRARRPTVASDTSRPDTFAAPVFLVVAAVSVLLAAALSWKSYLLIGRCLVMLSPLILIVFAAWFDRAWTDERRRQFVPLSGALLGLMLTMFAFGMYWALEAPRSNSREVARALVRVMRPTDMLIIVPEWYAPAFNRYFPPSIKQIDYPFRSRAGLTDFSNVWPRTADSTALAWVSDQIRSARAAGNRTWLISGPKHLRAITNEEIADAMTYRDPELMILLRANQIRSALFAAYGAPDRSATPPGPRSRYNELFLELYSTDTASVGIR